jgi:hypothetical protein
MATMRRRLSNDDRVKITQLLSIHRATALRPGARCTQPNKRDSFGNRL